MDNHSNPGVAQGIQAGAFLPRCLLAAASLMLAAPAALAQRVPPQEPGAATMLWGGGISEFLTVEESKVWRVQQRVNIGVQPQVLAFNGACSVFKRAAEGGVLMPVFTRGATANTVPQSVLFQFIHPFDAARVKGGVTIDPPGWLGRPKGLNGYVAWRLSAPEGAFSIGGRIELESELVARRVKPNVQAILAAPWWDDDLPEDAAEVMTPQVFLERGVDRRSTQVRDLRTLELDQRARAFMEAARIRQPRDVTPGKLAFEVAGEVLRAVRLRGEGIARESLPLPCGVSNIIDPTPSPAPSNVRWMEFTGFETRDALTVLRDGQGNRIERALALAAVLRQLGIPARFVLGFDADRGDGDDDAPRMNASRRREPSLRPWVEFALIDEAKGLTHWIPIDPGGGAGLWRFGFLDNGENRVPIATCLWHPQTEAVGLVQPCYSIEPEAGLWGFWSVGSDYTGIVQKLSLSITEPSTNEVRRGSRRPRPEPAAPNGAGGVSGAGTTLP